MESVERRSGAGLPTNPLHWTETQLGAFLQSRGLPKSTASAFEDHLVNGLVAVDLSPEDLASMGICDDFQQRRLLLELRQLFAGGDVELLSKIETFLPEVQQPQVPPALAKRPESSRARPASPYLQALASKARRPKQKRSEEMSLSPEQQATAAAASLAGGLHASDVQAAIIAALPGALEAYLVPKIHPSVPSAPKHVPQKPSPRPGARRLGTAQARWQATQGGDRCRPAGGGEARPFEERYGDSTADMEEEARALIPLMKTMHLPDNASHQEPSTTTRVEELEAQLKAMQASLQEAARERLELKRQLQNSTDRSEALERQLGSTQRQCDELLKELQDANQQNEQHSKTMESLRTDLLIQQQQQQQQLQQELHQQMGLQHLQMREASSQCSLLAFTPSVDTKILGVDACSSPGQPPALPPRPRRDEAAWSAGSSSGAEAVIGNLTASFEAAWQAPGPDQGGFAGGRSSSQRQLDQICDEFRLQVRDLVATRPPRPQCAASIADAIEMRKSAVLDKTAKLEEESSEQVPIRIAASQEASFPELDSQFVDATVAELAESALANAE